MDENKKNEIWRGFRIKKVLLDNREAIVVFPEEGKSNGKWVLKTEYFDAFPDVEIELLKLGYFVAHIKNITRWCVEQDTDARAILAEYMHSEYGLSKKCVIVGMSCGGMQGIFFAAKYPQYVSCMYLDAPVVNFLSCPAGFGDKENNDMLAEFELETGINRIDLLSYRNHPLDHLNDLVKKNIPIILICGDSDTIVPYSENGKLIDEIYRKNNCTIETIIKKGCNHHPHSLEDNSPIIDFILKYDR